MYITNTHERYLPTPADQAGTLLDTLGSINDKLWPVSCWPKMSFTGPLGIGARGGHGPIGYEVEMYKKSQLIRFRFMAPEGFKGFHEFRIIPHDRACILRHTLEMRVTGLTTLSWLCVYRPLHNSLLEDALATAQHSLGFEPEIVVWSPWVRLLRRILADGKIRPQRIK